MTRFDYDNAGNETQITDPAGNVTRFEYEPTFNRLTKFTDLLGHVTTLMYDARGNLTSLADPLGNVTQIAYDAFGQPTSITDPLRNITIFTHDLHDNPAAITDPLSNTTRRSYDLVGRLITQTDPRGNPIHFSYNELNQITRIVDALNGETRFTYDENGNVLTITDALDHTTNYAHDNMDQLSQCRDSLGATESFEYDPMGNLIHHTDRKGQVSTFSYELLGHQVRANYVDNTMSFIYDSVGRLVQASDSAGGEILDSYDMLDRLSQKTTGLGTINYTYDALDRRTSMSVPEQAPISYSYDTNSRLTQITQDSQIVDFSYDELGRRIRLTLPNNVTTEYRYDAASCITELVYRNAVGVLGNLTYEYDSAGNRIRVGGSFARALLPDPVATTDYDAANRQLRFGDKQMTFDANGNLTLITETGGVITDLMWDARNQLVAFAAPGATASFIYDPFGRRTDKLINGQLTQHLYDGADIVQELASGTLINSLRSLSIDELLVRNSNEYHLAGELGSSIALTDTAGVVQTEYTYEPFGRTKVAGVATSPFQYTGRENDGTGLHYYRARYYSPVLQRFIAEDPLRIGIGSTLYSYLSNNPLNGIDPYGLAWYAYQPGDSQNPWGHSYIGIDRPDGRGIDWYSFYPNGKWRGDPGLIIRHPPPQNAPTVKVPTTREQDEAMRRKVQDLTAGKGQGGKTCSTRNYDFPGYVCNSFVGEVFRASGVPAKGLTPEQLYDNLKNQYSPSLNGRKDVFVYFLIL